MSDYSWWAVATLPAATTATTPTAVIAAGSISGPSQDFCLTQKDFWQSCWVFLAQVKIKNKVFFKNYILLYNKYIVT
jgi:hypothetical protein